MSKFLKTLLVFFTIFTFLTLILFWPIFLGKVNLNGNLLVSFYAPYGQNLPYKHTGWDQLRIYFPFYKVTLDQIKDLKFPLWNPYAFSGHPHMADFQTAVFYPLNLVGLFLPQIEFWHLLRISPMILASFFTFLYLRSLRPFDYAQGQISKVASFFGALTFGFSPFILTWGEEVVMSPHSIVWLPLILFAIDGFLASEQKKFLVLISLSTAFSLFGGHIQTSIYMFIFAFAYIIFRVWEMQKDRSRFGGIFRNGIVICSAFVLGTALAAIQLLPSGELYFNSARADIALKETLFGFLLPVESVVTFLAADFFGHPATANFFRDGRAQYYEGILFVGIAVLIFALGAVFSKKTEVKNGRLERFVKFMAIGGLVSLSTTFDLPTSRLFLSLPIPFLSTSIANRILFVSAFCLAVLAAVGMDHWFKKKHEGIRKVVKFMAILYLGIFFYLLAVKFADFSYWRLPGKNEVETATVSLRNMAIPGFVFLVTSFLVMIGSQSVKYLKIAAILVIIVAMGHIFYFSQKYFSFSKRSYIFPENPVLKFIAKNQGSDRSLGVGDAYFENNFASQYGIFWPEGYDSLNNHSYGEFTHWMQGNAIETYVFRADAGLGRGKISDLLGNAQRRRLIDLVGVKFLLVGRREDEDVFKRFNFSKVFDAGDGKFAVWENQQALPRVLLASNYEGPPHVDLPEGEAKTKERRKLIVSKLLSADFDFRNVLILEKPSPISPQFGSGSAQVLSYKPSEVIIKTKSDQPKLLFISDNYYPGWKAQVDGDETEILRANYTFRTVPLIPGEHLVRFYYDSDVFKLGALISLASLGLLIYLTLGKNLLLG